MRVKFIDGHFTQNGWLCIRKRGKTVCGYYLNDITEHFKMVDYREVVTKKESKKVIWVVKQKSRWYTFRILCHELAHWLFDMLLPCKLQDRLDNWLDRD